MISPVSFKGNLFLTGGTRRLTKMSEAVEMKMWADSHDCDVVVLSKEANKDGSGKYYALIVNEDEDTGENSFNEKFFDFHQDETYEKLD